MYLVNKDYQMWSWNCKTLHRGTVYWAVTNWIMKNWTMTDGFDGYKPSSRNRGLSNTSLYCLFTSTVKYINEVYMISVWN